MREEGAVHPGEHGEAEEESHAGAIGYDDNAAMHRPGNGEPALPFRCNSYGKTVNGFPAAVRITRK